MKWSPILRSGEGTYPARRILGFSPGGRILGFRGSLLHPAPAGEESGERTQQRVGDGLTGLDGLGRA